MIGFDHPTPRSLMFLYSVANVFVRDHLGTHKALLILVHLLGLHLSAGEDVLE